MHTPCVMVLAVVLPVMLSLLLTPALIESPHWLLEQGKRQEATAVLETLAGRNGRPPLADDLRDSLLSRPSSGGSTRSSRLTGTAGGTGGGGGEKEYLSTRELGASGAADVGLDYEECAHADGMVAAGVGGGSSSSAGATAYSATAYAATAGSATAYAATAGSATAGSGRQFGGSFIASCRASHHLEAAPPSAPWARGVRALLRPLGMGRGVDILTEAGLRPIALVHWLLWLVAGFGWAGLVYFQTFILADDSDGGGGGTNGTGRVAHVWTLIARCAQSRPDPAMIGSAWLVPMVFL